MSSVDQQRIDRINCILDRLDAIPEEIDVIHEQLFAGNMSRDAFTRLVDRRKALYIELENKKRELHEVYRITTGGEGDG